MTSALRPVLATSMLALGLLVGGLSDVRAASVRHCLVLADGYVSEYAWGGYQEAQFPLHHPSHDVLMRGLLQDADRFSRWLPAEAWQVQRLDLEKQRGTLPLRGVDLVILDDVRQCVCDPYEPALVEFVRQGGALLVYAGHWGLGGCPKTEYCVPTVVSSYAKTPLGAILPVAITATPDLEMLSAKPEAARHPVFLDAALGAGIDVAAWQVFGLHACAPRGETLAELDGRPLVSRGSFGAGHVVVYSGDDFAWVRAGTTAHVNAFGGTLWRRLAALAVGDREPVPALAEAPPSWEKPPAFAHPDQPMNFQWGGYFYWDGALLQQLWARDLVTHSSTLYFGAPKALGEAGIQGWQSSGPPLFNEISKKTPEAWMVDAAGKPIANTPCFNNPQALANLDTAMGDWAAKQLESPWVTYGHMGDETEYSLCFCEPCRRAFREQFGAELPPLKNDFSAAYLDQWIDYQIFRNRSIGAMYARAGQAARARNPQLKMFASLPISGGMCHGDDQFHTQSGFDLRWDHTYPGTMAITVGLNAALLEETAVLQGRPEIPILDLLQGFDSYDHVPHMPPPEYMREMTWQAIAHGVDSVGWFVYHAFFWTLPGSAAWEECGRLAHELLEPMTPTLYEMRNAPQPIGLLYSYSQESVDGLKEQVFANDEPWKGVIRWWSHHATQEAYETLTYAQVPFNVVSEFRLLEGGELPWKALIIPYVEHLHAKSRKALEGYIARGGQVYVGANSTLELPRIVKLPVSFDTKFTTWWPKERRDEWNQRRVRGYLIDAFLQKADCLSTFLAPLCATARVTVADPEVVCSVRTAGAATYLFFINDHQLNPLSPELRKQRQKYNHFMLMPMEFPTAETSFAVRGPGYLYRVPAAPGKPRVLKTAAPQTVPLALAGGDGAIYLLLPEPIRRVEFTAPPVREAQGVRVEARLLGRRGVIDAALPLRLELVSGAVQQTVFATTKQGLLSWTVPFLRDFPAGPIQVTLTDLAAGKQDRAPTR
jgi:hypothetical protein